MRAYLSVAEIAKVTKKEKTTVLRWIGAGKFGNVRKVGNEYRVPHEEFKRWWDEEMKGTELSERQK